MKKIITITMLSLLASGCVSNSPPVCYNKANIYKEVYDVAVFKVENDRYLAGNPFYTWTDKSQFIDTSSCDKLNP